MLAQGVFLCVLRQAETSEFSMETSKLAPNWCNQTTFACMHFINFARYELTKTITYWACFSILICTHACLECLILK